MLDHSFIHPSIHPPVLSVCLSEHTFSLEKDPPSVCLISQQTLYCLVVVVVAKNALNLASNKLLFITTNTTNSTHLQLPDPDLLS